MTLREQVFSPGLNPFLFRAPTMNVAQVELFAGGIFLHSRTHPGTPAATVPGFLVGIRSALLSSADAASNRQAAIGLAGSNNGRRSFRSPAIYIS